MMKEDRNAVRSRELSIFLGEALTILSTSSYDDCSRVMNIIQSYNLDLPHYDHAIQAAAVEKNWAEAARLFRQKIDPDEAGYTPVEVSVQNPLGLYAIAKDAQKNQDGNVADRVMDAVLNLTMVSPTDQEKCECMTINRTERRDLVSLSHTKMCWLPGMHWERLVSGSRC